MALTLIHQQWPHNRWPSTDFLCVYIFRQVIVDDYRHAKALKQINHSSRPAAISASNNQNSKTAERSTEAV
jgi:hypothetical protein